MLQINAIKEKYGTEMALVILCCRVYFGSAGVIELSDFITTNEIDWQSFIRLTRMHRIRPIVFKMIAWQSIPDNIKSQIRDRQFELIKASLNIAAETERVILLLKQIGVEAIPYKGVAYSKQFFGDLVSREISDIDLVIQPLDLTKAVGLLASDGYEPELEDIHQFLGEKYFSYFKDYNLNKQKDGTRLFHLELHWGVTEKEIGVNLKAGSLLYGNYIKEKVVKAEILTLPALSHFSAMLIHNTFKDNLIFLKNIVDISQAMKLPELQNDSGLLIEQFKKFGIQKSLSVNNKLAEQLMGISLPRIESFGDSDQTAGYFLDQVCLRQTFAKDDKETMAARIKDTAMLQDNLIKKVLYYWLCLQFRFIPGRFDFRYVQLPKPLFFTYYFIKPFRTLKKTSAGQAS